MSETIIFEQFCLNDLIDSVVEDFQLLCQQRDIQLRVKMDERVSVNPDRDKMKRLLINLLENAVKYNRDEGDINLQLKKSYQNNKVIITIFNSVTIGQGIPLEDRERVFDQFYRVKKSRSSSLGGSGLGLTIVKRIVELHDGDISLQSKPDEWIQIEMILPVLVKE